MNANDSDSFFKLWDNVSDIYDKPRQGSAKKIIFKLCSRYSIEEVAAAVEAHLSDPEAGKFMPRPADIIGKIQAASKNKWLGADEAWALFPHDESQSGVVCEEMLKAFGTAAGLDHIAGRMAFRDCYNRLVGEAKLKGLEPVWKMSLGQDKHLREVATLEAVEQGRIGSEYASRLLPHLPEDEIKQIENQSLSPQRLITNNEQKLIGYEELIEGAASDDFAREQLAALKKTLGITNPDKKDAA